MENYHDTPATHEQNTLYQSRPDDPISKPYSTKQLASNERAANRTMLYSLEHGEAKNNYGKVFSRAEADQAKRDGWSDVCPLHPKEVELGLNKKKKAEAESPLIDILRREADDKGVKYDKRWGVDKLREALST